METQNGTTTYEYNKQYAMTKAEDKKAGVYEYDATGNLSFDGEKRFYYDFANRLVKVTDVNGKTVSEYKLT